MKFEDPSYERAVLHHRGAAARDVFSGGAAKRGLSESHDVTETALIHCFSIRRPASSSPADKVASAWQSRCRLIAEALVWLFNEIVLGFAAYANAIHPIVRPRHYETPNQDEVPEYQAYEQRRANTQERDAISGCEAYVRVVVQDARPSPNSGGHSG